MRIRKKNDTTMKIDTETNMIAKKLSFEMSAIEGKRIPQKEVVKRTLSDAEIRKMLLRGSFERKRGYRK